MWLNYWKPTDFWIVFAFEESLDDLFIIREFFFYSTLMWGVNYSIAVCVIYLSSKIDKIQINSKKNQINSKKQKFRCF